MIQKFNIFVCRFFHLENPLSFRCHYKVYLDLFLSFSYRPCQPVCLLLHLLKFWAKVFRLIISYDIFFWYFRRFVREWLSERDEPSNFDRILSFCLSPFFGTSLACQYRYYQFVSSVFPLFFELLWLVNFLSILLKMLPQNQPTRWSNRLSNFFSFKKPLKLSSNETPNVTLNHFGQILSINKERIKMNFNFWNEAIFSFFFFFGLLTFYSGRFLTLSAWFLSLEKVKTVPMLPNSNSWIVFILSTILNFKCY